MQRDAEDSEAARALEDARLRGVLKHQSEIRRNMPKRELEHEAAFGALGGRTKFIEI